MAISNTLMKTVELSMDTIFGATGTDIRVHGRENVPDQPVLYVVNHFTRMETFLMPYIIKKKIDKFPISLAHESLMGGKLGEFISKLGAISTTDPNRDAIFIGSLLTDINPVIIFPEGQMVKDKKLIEKGKYMVYNAGIRRPPHTGAAHIALLSQFIREKLRHFHDRGDTDAIARYGTKYGFNTTELERIIGLETHIVPVNITYYPIRSRDNAINKLASRFVKDMDVRYKEELEIEGAMVMGGVDIDINFGKPFAAGKYLHSSKEIEAMIADDVQYLTVEEIRNQVPFRKLDVTLMKLYMDSIYGMTTVNHDHIFSYLLTRYPKNIISEDDFKNRSFMAIDLLRKSGINNYHTSLNRKQFYLLTDDYHDKYANFIETAVSNGLITVKDGVICRNRERFTKVYDFHTIRKDNIIEVLKNEIEPLLELIKRLNRLMLPPDFWVRRKIRNQFIELERELFEKDYNKYYIKNESKPKNIGEPFFLKRFFSRGGVILVHGYMAAPEEIRPLADHLHRNGFTVYGARLRGHGTAPEDLATRNWEKWYDSVGRAYIIMKNTMKNFAIGGFSTGAGIALLQAANKPGHFKGIVSINAPLKLQNITSKLTSAMVMWNKFLGKIQVTRGKLEFVTNTPENQHINYFRNPVYGVSELGKLMNVVEDNLKFVQEPTLIIQGSDDPVVNPVSGLEIFGKLGTQKKQLVRIYAKHHGIIRGKEADEVKSKVLEFMKKVFSK